MRQFATRALTGACFCVLASGCGTTDLPDFDPVSLESGSNTIRLELLGRFTGGFFDLTSTTPPAYDPVSQRLFVVRTDVGLIDVLDLSGTGKPRRFRRIKTLDAGGLPISLDVKKGVLAVALRSLVKTQPGRVAFFTVDGERIGRSVQAGVQPNAIAFDETGRWLLVANAGEANDEYTIDPEGSATLIELDAFDEADCRAGAAGCDLDPDVTQLDFRAFNSQRAALIGAGVRIFGPGASVAEDLEPEALTFSPDSLKAWVVLQRNNAVAVVDVPGATILEVIALGSKDHNLPGMGLDASDVDGAINIRPWPIRSFYQPDNVAAFQVAGQTFLVTVNEGDPRDFDGFSEETRVSALSLDPAAFPNAADLQQDSNLGRLRVTNVEGDIDGDGDFDLIFHLGSRSFATWTQNWALVFDSGDDLEQVGAQAVPAFFNVSDDGITFDSKSDDRGPEPETLTVGSVGARQYVFIAPERIGGVYAYDITDPAAPTFQQYINFRNFAVDPEAVCEKDKPQSPDCAEAGDLGPEGILFIPKDDSPIDAALVVVVHEVSDSTTVYRVDEVP